MDLGDLFAALGTGAAAKTPVAEVLRITADSREVRPGTVFVAVRGSARDGHAFLREVIAHNPLALVVEKGTALPAPFSGSVAFVDDGRRALTLLARAFFGDPARELACVGVTGTNGKTTLTYMVEAILSAQGWPTGVVGTIDHHLGQKKWPSELTTPDPITLQKRLREFVAAGAKAAAFEISSHALHQARAEGLPLKVGIFTNFTRDHLDYHGSMDEYFAAKQIMFTNLLEVGGTAVLNGDDTRVRQTRVRAGARTWFFGASSADFVFTVRDRRLSGTTFRLRTPVGEVDVDLQTPGTHNVANATAAIAAAVALGVPPENAARALREFTGAPGRLERVPDSKGRFIFVDYAHTDDALTTVLSSLDEIRRADPRFARARITTVFGCGGDRDRGKRPLMARAACALSDRVILTSDNPRTENPERILDDIAAGVPSGWRGELRRQTDRREALKVALQSAAEGDVILVAGKGHEDYQLIGRERREFSDRRALIELLGE